MDENQANVCENVEQDAAFETPTQTNGQFRKSSMATRRQQQRIFIIVMLAIPVAHWLIQWVFINTSAILMAFQNRYGEFDPKFQNFVDVFEMLFDNSGNSILSKAFSNTVLTFCMAEFVGVPITLTVSYFIYKQIKCYKTFRIIFYLPHIISGIVLVTAFKQLVSPLGPINALCESMGITLSEGEGLLHTESTATWTIIFYTIWTGACGNILFYSAMSRIPPELIEVGKLEGLQLFKELIYVIMPLIWPTFSTQLIFMMTGLFSSSGPILLFTNGEKGTSTISYWIFAKLYGSGGGGATPVGYANVATLGLCLTAILVPIIMLSRKLVERVESYDY